MKRGQVKEDKEFEKCEPTFPWSEVETNDERERVIGDCPTNLLNNAPFFATTTFVAASDGFTRRETLSLSFELRFSYAKSYQRKGGIR